MIASRVRHDLYKKTHMWFMKENVGFLREGEVVFSESDKPNSYGYITVIDHLGFYVAVKPEELDPFNSDDEETSSAFWDTIP